LRELDQPVSRRRFLRLLDGHDEKEERVIYPDIPAHVEAHADALLNTAIAWPIHATTPPDVQPCHPALATPAPPARIGHGLYNNPLMPAIDSVISALSDPRQRHPGLRIIAFYEIIKTSCLLLVALAAFHFYRQQNFEHLVRWLEHLSLADSNGLRWKLVELLHRLGPGKFQAVGLVALGYAVLFGIEGVGLWLGKHWAEWFTVIATGSLVPLELYETLYHFGWIKLATLVGNVAIIVYLVRIALQPRAAASGPAEIRKRPRARPSRESASVRRGVKCDSRLRGNAEHEEVPRS
jgi:uncharacterized membrane protein (DUF2068 family)